MGQRKLWGIVALAERYPRRLVDRACAQALAEVIHSYQHVKRLTTASSTTGASTLRDATMGTTILDRLMHRAVMLEFKGKSYRLKEAAARLALNTAEAY